MLYSITFFPLMKMWKLLSTPTWNIYEVCPTRNYCVSQCNFSKHWLTAHIHRLPEGRPHWDMFAALSMKPGFSLVFLCLSSPAKINKSFPWWEHGIMLVSWWGTACSQVPSGVGVSVANVFFPHWVNLPFNLFATRSSSGQLNPPFHLNTVLC